MGKIGVYLERYTISNSYEMEALMRFGQVARKLGHQADYLFRPDMYKIPDYDAIFIRALTDPLNSSYVAARIAEMHGIRVIDDPDSIIICCDKVNMYRRLMRDGVPLPETHILDRDQLNRETGAALLRKLGKPIVLKAPHTSFSMYVEKARTPEEFTRTALRFTRRADRVVVQRFIPSDFDWRVGILDGRVLYVCQYRIPSKRWKILTYTNEGRAIYGAVKGLDVDRADPNLIDAAVRAARAIGDGFYGVDLKQAGNEFVVIEVNDNPTIMAGDEDQKAPQLYEALVRYLMNDGYTV